MYFNTPTTHVKCFSRQIKCEKRWFCINGESSQGEELKGEIYTDVYHNDVNIFWMIPQYFIITLGEVFLSVTGLEFSYSQVSDDEYIRQTDLYIAFQNSFTM